VVPQDISQVPIQPTGARCCCGALWMALYAGCVTQLQVGVCRWRTYIQEGSSMLLVPRGQKHQSSTSCGAPGTVLLPHTVYSHPPPDL
jgi:hypothetical protein